MVEIWRRIHEDLKVNSDDDSIRFFFWLEFSSFFLSPIYWELWYSRGWKFQDKHHALQQAKVMPIPKWQEIWNKNNRFQVWKSQGSIKMFMIVSGFLCRILSKKRFGNPQQKCETIMFRWIYLVQTQQKSLGFYQCFFWIFPISF